MIAACSKFLVVVLEKAAVVASNQVFQMSAFSLSVTLCFPNVPVVIWIGLLF